MKTKVLDPDEKKDLGKYKSICRIILNIKLIHNTASLKDDYDIPVEYFKTISGHNFIQKIIYIMVNE